ncbi:MAG: ArsA family ATPase [Pleomorphochaeta sp.]
MEKINIFLGKGGVGKSTCSSMEAIKLSKSDNKVLLDSLDPAHNLHDIFNQTFSNKVKKVVDNLYIRESDISLFGKKYIKATQEQLKGLYHYQQSLNIDRYFSILKYAPGTEEYAALLALERCLTEKKYDNVVIDTPPTALTLKTLALPSVNLHWINSLIEMRSEIVNKKNTIKNIRKENQELLSEDPIYNRLLSMKKRYDSLNDKLKDSNLVEFVLILNEDELSFSESLLIKKEMKELAFSIDRIIINKSSKDNFDFYNRIKEAFPSSIIQLNPMIQDKLSNVEKLINYNFEFISLN